jgi:endoglucanase
MRTDRGRLLGSIRSRRLLVAFAVVAVLAPQAVTAAQAAAPKAFVRLNQVGYPTGAAKRAYLMASASQAGARFSVEDLKGRSVYAAAVGANLGRWSAAYPFVYALDFGAVRRAGRYTISVHGTATATSPRFQIATGERLYAASLTNSLRFFQDERDGPNFIPSALRTAPGHLNDRHAMTYLTPTVDEDGNYTPEALGTRIDASGGWWDAGDYPKFVETHNYTVAMLLLGVRDFPRQMGARSLKSNFTREARFGLDWLLKMWNDRTRTLYYQVGIGDGTENFAGDHDIWRLPQDDDTYGGTDPVFRFIRNRPVFRAGPPGSPVSPNLAGRNAAAFALCYQVFQRTDPAYARRCLLAAEHIFALADTSPTGDLTTIFPFDGYPETEWHSDMELGATQLYLALAHGTPPRGLPHRDAGFYLRTAAHWARAYIDGPDDAADTLNLYDVAGAAHYDLYRAIGSRHIGHLEVTRADLLADLAKQLAGAVAQARSDPFGFGFPWAAFDTTSHGAGLSVLASEYNHLTRGGRRSAAATEANRWLGNILGANAWGTSLIVGDGSTFPNCMQHQVTNLVGSLDGTPPVLAGAAVEGPNDFAASGTVDGMRDCPPNHVDAFAPFNSKAIYQDNVESWSTVEPAIDLTASSPLAFAWQMSRS